MKAAIVVLSGFLFFGAGCMNLGNEAIIPSLIKHSPVSQDTAGRAGGSAAALASTGTSGSKPQEVGALSSQLKAVPIVYLGLDLLNKQVHNSSVDDLPRQVTRPGLEGPGGTEEIVFEYIDQAGPLDEHIAGEPAIKTLLASAQDVVMKQEPRGSISLIRGDRFALALVDSVKRLSSQEPSRQKNILESIRSIEKRATAVADAVQANQPPPVPTTTIEVSLDAIMVAYLEAYIQGKYHDRNGTLISQPDLSKKIGADTLTAFESVLLDAIFDYATLTPIVYDAKAKSRATNGSAIDSATVPAGSSQLPQDSKPTFAVLFPDLYQPVQDDPHKGITSDELGLIQFLGGIGGEQSKHISSAVIRLFGGASFVAKLSVGDNDTISKSVSTFFQEFVERTVSAVGYDFFNRFSCTATGSNPNKEYALTDDDLAANKKNLGIDADTSQAVVDAVQYQQLINQLFLPKGKQATRE